MWALEIAVKSSGSTALCKVTSFFWALWTEISAASVSLSAHEGLICLTDLFEICDLEFLFYLSLWSLIELHILSVVFGLGNYVDSSNLL